MFWKIKIRSSHFCVCHSHWIFVHYYWECRWYTTFSNKCYCIVSFLVCFAFCCSNFQAMLRRMLISTVRWQYFHVKTQRQFFVTQSAQCYQSFSRYSLVTSIRLYQIGISSSYIYTKRSVLWFYPIFYLYTSR